MPCSDGGPSHYEDSELTVARRTIRKQKKKLDEYARLLCFIMSNITVGEKEMLYRLPKTEEHGDAPQELLNWWVTHQQEDAKEVARKASLKRQAEHDAEVARVLAKQKNDALKKLSPKERKLLGLT